MRVEALAVGRERARTPGPGLSAGPLGGPDLSSTADFLPTTSTRWAVMERSGDWPLLRHPVRAACTLAP